VDERFWSHFEAGRYREAFEMLVEAFGNKAFRPACSIVQDEDLAKDVTQEVFLRVWRALPAFERRSSPATWIYAITRNLCLSRSARRNVEHRRERSGAPPPASVQAPARAGPDLERALANLPPRYRQLLILFYYEEKSYEAVAEMLGLPLGTVKTQLHRARNQLRAALEEQQRERSRAVLPIQALARPALR